ncbi:hypothetical protein C0J52_03103, partial [Blattella germanica]
LQAPGPITIVLPFHYFSSLQFLVSVCCAAKFIIMFNLFRPWISSDRIEVPVDEAAPEPLPGPSNEKTPTKRNLSETSPIAGKEKMEQVKEEAIEFVDANTVEDFQIGKIKDEMCQIKEEAESNESVWLDEKSTIDPLFNLDLVKNEHQKKKKDLLLLLKICLYFEKLHLVSHDVTGAYR